jgi:hypothetical protein
MKTAAYLRKELRELYDDGVLTDLDVKKISDDSKLSGQAVINAINQSDYPENMRRALVDHLIGQYEASIEDILKEARSRRYSPERIEARLEAIEGRIIPNMSDAVERRLVSRQQSDEISKIISEQRDEITKGIKTIPRQHPKKPDLIETWLLDYEEKLQQLVQRYLPKLTDRLNVSHEDELNDTSNPPSEEEAPAIKKKGLFESLFGGK